MLLVGAAGQQVIQETYDASGTITTGGTVQLLLPRTIQRTYLFFQNTSDTAMYLDFGGARATATLTSGAVTSCAVTNVGFGFSYAPLIRFIGGGPVGAMPNNRFLTPGIPPYSGPSNVAQAHCVMTGAAPNMTISSIVIDNPGSGYKNAPYVRIENDLNDPFGSAAVSATTGIVIPPNGGNLPYNGTFCLTDSISLFCATTGKSFIAKYAV